MVASSGEIVIEKHWREVTPRSVCDFFWDEANLHEDRRNVPPILFTGDVYLISVLRGDLFLIATVKEEYPPLLVIEFLHRVADIIHDYFGSVEENTLKENFSTVYQLLEEMMDNGFPLTTEPNALKAMIRPPSMISKIAEATIGASGVSETLPEGTVSNMPWRKTGVRYSQNEIYVDIIEEVDAIVDVNGQVVSSEVTGLVHCNSMLSGLPDLTLAFVDPDVIDDCSFHPCVRYNRYDRDRVVSFVPPDGMFELMCYRVRTHTHVAPPLYATPQLSYEIGPAGTVVAGRVSLLIGSKPSSSLKIPPRKGPIAVEEVVITMPFPKSVRTANLSASHGTILYDEATKVARWNLGTLPRDGQAQCTGSLVMSGPRPEESPPIEVFWKVPNATISGVAVASLQLVSETYRPYKGVRTLTRAGRYHVRTS
eukprot:scaffold2141_cov282-Pinguiococcus_pyrenoidosus.AAC.1